MRKPPPRKNLEALPSWITPEVARVVIEVPAGAGVKRRYDPATGRFPDLRYKRKLHTVEYLPYPANYGFVCGTLWPASAGGDGGALDIWVLCGALPSGTVLGVQLLGVVRIMDEGERNDKLVGIPVDPRLRRFEAMHIKRMPLGALAILEKWIVHHGPESTVIILDVKGPKTARKLIERWKR